jgi:hypothetical protein
MGIPYSTTGVTELSFAPTGHACASFFQWDQVVTLIAPSPAGFSPCLDNLIQFPIFRAILSCRVRITLAHEADPRIALVASYIGRILWVQLLVRWNKFAARRVWTEHPCLPGRAVLNNGLQKLLLDITTKQVPYDGSG